MTLNAPSPRRSIRATRVAACTVLLAAALTGCGGDGASSAAAADGAAWSSRDSAGVEIIETRLGSGGPIWDVWADTELVATIGEDLDAPPAYQFEFIRGVHILGDTAIAVVESGSASEVRLFDFEGRHIRTIGTRGEGPGEFTQLAGPGVVFGDSISLLAPNDQRVVTLPLDGGPGRSAPFPWADRVLRIQSGVWPGDRRIPATGFPLDRTRHQEGEWFETPLVFGTVDPTTGESTVLLETVGRRQQMVDGSSRGEVFGSSNSLIGREDGVMIQNRSVGELRFFDRQMRPTRIVRFMGDRRPVTQADRDEYLNRRLRSLEEADGQRVPDEVRDLEILFADSLPVLRAAGRDFDDFWHALGHGEVYEQNREEGWARSRLYGPNFRYLGSAQWDLNAGGTIVAWSDAYVVVQRRTDFGVSFLNIRTRPRLPEAMARRLEGAD